MPQWIHDRAEHILAKNPSMDKSQAFALATQQSHVVGKTPKSYGTVEGRQVAKAKYKTPKDDKKKANPGNLDSSKMAAFYDELAKVASDGELSWDLMKVAAGEPWYLRAGKKAVNWATTPKAEDLGAAGMTGVNRFKQLLGGHRARARCGDRHA